MVAHEMRTPLGIILQFLNMLQLMQKFANEPGA